MNWLLTIVIKAVLEWLMSLLVRLRRNEELRQEGRDEVADNINKKYEEAKDALDKLIQTRANLTDDDIARELRDGYNSNKANLPNN